MAPQVAEPQLLACPSLEVLSEVLKSLGRDLVQRDADISHRLVLHSLDALMRTSLVETVEAERQHQRRYHAAQVEVMRRRPTTPPATPPTAPTTAPPPPPPEAMIAPSATSADECGGERDAHAARPATAAASASASAEVGSSGAFDDGGIGGIGGGGGGSSGGSGNWPGSSQPSWLSTLTLFSATAAVAMSQAQMSQVQMAAEAAAEEAEAEAAVAAQAVEAEALANVVIEDEIPAAGRRLQALAAMQTEVQATGSRRDLQALAAAQAAAQAEADRLRARLEATRAATAAAEAHEHARLVHGGSPARPPCTPKAILDRLAATGGSGGLPGLPTYVSPGSQAPRANREADGPEAEQYYANPDLVALRSKRSPGGDARASSAGDAAKKGAAGIDELLFYLRRNEQVGWPRMAADGRGMAPPIAAGWPPIAAGCVLPSFSATGAVASRCCTTSTCLTTPHPCPCLPTRHPFPCLIHSCCRRDASSCSSATPSCAQSSPRAAWSRPSV